MKLAAIFAAAALAISAGQALAQDTFPAKTVTFVVPLSPGGAADLVARFMSEKLGQIWNQPVIVENKPGGGGAIGSKYISEQKPDGYTLLFATGTFTMFPAAQPTLPYDPVKDFIPVATVGSVPMALVTGPAFDAKTYAEFVERAKKDPPKYASAGTGSINHFAAELVNKEAGIKMSPVQFKGGADALAALVGGHVGAYVSSLTQAVPFVKDKSLTALAVTSDERVDVLPDVPTFKELGLNNVNVTQWWGIFAPAGTPPEVVKKINDGVAEVLEMDETKSYIAKNGGIIYKQSPEQFKEFISADMEKWQKIAKDSGIVE